MKAILQRQIKKFLKRFQGGFDIPKLTRSIITVSIFQTIAVVYCLVLAAKDGTLGIPSLVLTVTAGLNSVVSIQGAWALLHSYNQFRQAEESVRELEEFNRTLRAQRHDFKNHVQVLSALLDMEEYDEARTYLSRVSSDLKTVGRAMRTSQPAVNALLQAKSLLCEQRGVLFEMDITATLETLPMAAWELCRALGNLIDNAIEAQEMADVKDPVIRLTVFEKDSQVVIIVFNNGTRIPESMRETIFLPDISTKGKGRGMGLSIVRSVMDECGGEVRVDSDENGTAFTLRMPFAQKVVEPQ